MGMTVVSITHVVVAAVALPESAVFVAVAVVTSSESSVSGTVVPTVDESAGSRLTVDVGEVVVVRLVVYASVTSSSETVVVGGAVPSELGVNVVISSPNSLVVSTGTSVFGSSVESELRLVTLVATESSQSVSVATQWPRLMLYECGIPVVPTVGFAAAEVLLCHADVAVVAMQVVMTSTVVVSVTRLRGQPVDDDDNEVRIGKTDVLPALVPLVVWLCAC
ncbi:hypothetical protein PpBr36_07710 [Pyricularia pennisetigena]|uniref:hypothetical protein n=1 Tax=Pyricularia pennisetigena TaxID=1578925 RepID=UPI001152E2A3|nr:hypothetical protein PpBr36_07710 [Pyricularia pennisetigena]TLS25438.1 hypothetical protein PpBr36_07710 [Pyricularia pennisetigena]